MGGDNVDYIIRDVEEQDLMQVAEIAVNGWKKAYRGIIDDDYLDSLSVEQKYERMKSNFKEGAFIVAANEEQVLGFCRFSEEYSDNAGDSEVDCELCALYVSWEERGNGIGAALVNYVKSYFRDAEKRKMIIWCLTGNVNARDFYEKMGGTIAGYKEFERGGRLYNEVGFVYDL